ncbi:MAG: LamG domain-containing protein, partial [Pseudomonadota bacterium]|nr:LamG domain-containing protein [Pseudomonadota bacterium]
NMDAGLDGIAIDLPALDVKPTHRAFLPLNIRVKDPLWPERDMLDVNVSVRPGEARTLWLDTRDRILPDGASLFVTIAAPGGGFGPDKLAGMRVRLVFKEAVAAKAEHVADRFEQARDNYSFLVEEQPNIRLYPMYDRFERDISDVLRVDPANRTARAYWVEKNPEQPYAPFIQPPPPPGVPLWAFRQVEALKLYRRFVDWWIDERQIENGEFGGGLSDDTDLVNQWVPLALMGVDPDRYTASVRRVLDATYANGMWTGGLSRIRTDELHSYEEGINAVAQAMQMSWGDPTAIERGMAVAREYGRLIARNSAGHMHFVSSYFSGADIVREGTLGWQRPYSFLILHPGLLLVNYNGAPAVRSEVLSLLDGWLAHGREERDRWILPAEIEWATDKARGSGIASAAHTFWAAYSWTGDEKYLRPMIGDIARGNLPALTQLNADLLARAPGGTDLAKRIVGGELAPTGAAIDRNLGGVGDRDFARFVRWQKGGDKDILAELFGKEVEANSQRMHILTEGHLWSDRVSVPSELLQRVRLGGVGHRRNAYFPGNLVSWRFEGNAKAEDLAILIPEGDPRRFRVIAYNLSGRPVSARMIGAELAPGAWSVVGGADMNGDDRADERSPARTVQLERGRGTELTFAPGQTTVYEFALVTPGDDPATRPDIGISADDLSLRANRLTMRVHSLGAKPT